MATLIRERLNDFIHFFRPEHPKKCYTEKNDFYPCSYCTDMIAAYEKVLKDAAIELKEKNIPLPLHLARAIEYFELRGNQEARDFALLRHRVGQQ